MGSESTCKTCKHWRGQSYLYKGRYLRSCTRWQFLSLPGYVCRDGWQPKDQGPGVRDQGSGVRGQEKT